MTYAIGQQHKWQFLFVLSLLVMYTVKKYFGVHRVHHSVCFAFALSEFHQLRQHVVLHAMRQGWSSVTMYE